MSCENHQEDLPTLNQTSDTLSPTSVLNWIQKLQTPFTSSYTPAREESPSRATKRCRSIDSTPSAFLGESVSYYKRLKTSYEKAGDEEATGEDVSEDEASDMAGNNVARMLTPSADASTSNANNTPTKTAGQSIKGAASFDPQTPKRQKTNTDEDAIGFKLSLHGLKHEDAAFDRAPAFKDYIMGLVTCERGSAMKDSSVEKVHNNIKVYKWSNEATFLWHIIPILKGEGYHVAGKPALGEIPKHQEEIGEWKNFLAEEFIIETMNRDFTRTLLPSKFSEKPGLIDEITKDLAKDKDMKNPRPDVTFGLQRDKHPIEVEAPISNEILALLEITPGMHHPFLILEGKSHSGSLATAENQARRGGATLVNASRTLRAILELDGTGPPDTATTPHEGSATQALNARKSKPILPDYNSFVFSITIDPRNFSIWVHWYDQGNDLYHMNHVDSYAIYNAKGPARIRWVMHNIIEWGARDRHTQNETLVRAIEEYIRRETRGAPARQLAAQRQVREARAASKAAKVKGQGASSAAKKRRTPEDENADEDEDEV